MFLPATLLISLGCMTVLPHAYSRTAPSDEESRSLIYRFEPASRIVNGDVASIEEFPYIVSLQYNGTFYGHDYDHFCCGSIISEQWIITSAQCAQTQIDFHVRIGSSEYYKNGEIYKVEKIVIHPNFNEEMRDYDVALLKLTKKITFNEHVKPIKLPRSCDVLRDSTNLSIVGWGASELLGSISDKLRASHVNKIKDVICQSSYGSNSITARMFCVFNEGYGPCVGDSGSPAVYKNRLIGLASWSYGCAYENPSVYLKISSVLGWIKKCTRE